jgi:hypothetical protein
MLCLSFNWCFILFLILFMLLLLLMVNDDDDDDDDDDVGYSDRYWQSVCGIVQVQALHCAHLRRCSRCVCVSVCECVCVHCVCVCVCVHCVHNSDIRLINTQRLTIVVTLPRNVTSCLFNLLFIVLVLLFSLILLSETCHLACCGISV